ncbi:hypothetical protein HY489_02955 [Candidatus Woesearchaeota archaeon]|nr:hypothetical protein [Candidatus Woesearchaeota archaeon]
MKRIAILILLLATLATAEQLKDKSYFITLHYSQGSVTVKNVTVGYGYAPDTVNQPTQGYKIVLKDYNNAIVYVKLFTIPNQIEAPMTPDGRWSPWITLDNFDFVVQLPYYTEGGTIEAQTPTGQPVPVEPGKPAALPGKTSTPSAINNPATNQVNVKPLAQCNQNKICDNRETSKTCTDCKGTQQGPTAKYLSGEKLTLGEAELEDLPLDDSVGIPCKTKIPPIVTNNLLWIILAIVIIAVVYWKKRKKS